VKKKIVCIFLLLALILTGCGQPQDSVPPGENPVTPSDLQTNETSAEKELLQEYLEKVELLQSPAREWGEECSLIEMEEDFVAHIRYPISKQEPLAATIENWVQQTLAYYKLEAENSTKTEGYTPELLIDYESFLVNEKLISVNLSGFFDMPYMAHPENITATFHQDASAAELLQLEDLLTESALAVLQKKVIEDAGISPDLVDEYLLQNWILTHEGLEIILCQGRYLPMSAGTVTLFYKLEELNASLAIPEDTEPSSPAEPETPTAPESPKPEAVPPKENTPNSEKPMIALTFDDGPSAHTARLLDIFAQHGGKGTFYVVGNALSNRAETLQRMANEGHEIGGHSWNHKQLTKLSGEDLVDQFMATRAKIYEITGVDPTTMRPPYGSYNDEVKKTAAELGIAMINWSVDTLDWKYRDADTVYASVMEQAKDGAIILCHDLHSTTVDAMERAIPDLLAQGYQLVTVTELLTQEGGSLTPGKVYFKQ